VLRFRRVIGVLICAVTMTTLVVGCGPNTGKVTGKVTYKGAPVPNGTISFVSSSGGKDAAPKSTRTSSEGDYMVKDLAPGDYKVYITTPKKGGAASLPGATDPSLKDMMPGATKSVEIPEKYAKAETSGLELKVEKGNQTKDFPLE